MLRGSADLVFPASGGPRHANHHVPNASGGRVCALGISCNCRLSAVFGCNCRYSAAIAGARLHTRLQLQMLGCNCRCSAAIAELLSCNCRFQIHSAGPPPWRGSEQKQLNCNCRLQIHSAGSPPRRNCSAALHCRYTERSGWFLHGGGMYCSHLLHAASVLNCRWLYYTQEDANGMYEVKDKPRAA